MGARTTAQHASDCYTEHFGAVGHVCEDIWDRSQWSTRHSDSRSRASCWRVPVSGLLGRQTPSQAMGIRGKKGVLWWSIYDMLALKRPPFVLLENVDRLLKSPSTQRGRDFAVILSCLAQLGYVAEWRVVNAADYGFPQRRRRVFLYCASTRRVRISVAAIATHLRRWRHGARAPCVEGRDQCRTRGRAGCSTRGATGRIRREPVRGQ